MNASLRPYQTDIVTQTFDAWKNYRTIMIQMPTGTGKTTVFSEIIRRQITEVQPNQRVLVLVHRKELIEQIYNRLKNFGISGGLIISGVEYDPNKQVQIASIQTLVRRTYIPKNISLIIIDEAHHSTASSYLKIIKTYSKENTKLLGVTATPKRTDGEGFSKVFEVLLKSHSIPEFVEMGFLSPLVHMAVSMPNLSGVKIDKHLKDYDIKELSKVMRNEKLIADVVESYTKYSNNKKAIVYAVNREHSKDIVSRFRECGISADFIDSETETADRETIVSKFKSGVIRVLSNVNIFTEGFDCPDIDTIILARPTKSLVLYFQQIGRVMRVAPNKPNGLILDNANLWLEHGLVTSNIKWSLEGFEYTKQGMGYKNSSNEVIPIDTRHTSIQEIKGLELVEIANSTISAAEKKDNSKIIVPANTLVMVTVIQKNSQNIIERVMDSSFRLSVNINYSQLIGTSIRLIYRKNELSKQLGNKHLKVNGITDIKILFGSTKLSTIDANLPEKIRKRLRIGKTKEDESNLAKLVYEVLKTY